MNCLFFMNATTEVGKINWMKNKLFSFYYFIIDNGKAIET
jgi:hypothetical protein